MFAQQQFENHLLVPKVMERQVGVSAVTVIIALLIGASLLGILGALCWPFRRPRSFRWSSRSCWMSGTGGRTSSLTNQTHCRPLTKSG